MTTVGPVWGRRGGVRSGMAMADRIFAEMFVYKIFFIYRKKQLNDLYDVLSKIGKWRSNTGAVLNLRWPGTNIQRRPYSSALMAKCQAAASW